MGDPGGSQLTAKTCNDEVNGDRGAHKQRKKNERKQKRKRRGHRSIPKTVHRSTRALPWAEM